MIDRRGRMLVLSWTPCASRGLQLSRTSARQKMEAIMKPFKLACALAALSLLIPVAAAAAADEP